jgi:hypothetical protein
MTNKIISCSGIDGWIVKESAVELLLKSEKEINYPAELQTFTLLYQATKSATYNNKNKTYYDTSWLNLSHTHTTPSFLVFFFKTKKTNINSMFTTVIIITIGTERFLLQE